MKKSPVKKGVTINYSIKGQKEIDAATKAVEKLIDAIHKLRACGININMKVNVK